LQQQVREYDLVARYGGEEFAVLLPNTTLDAALIMADRFRVLIETAQWPKRPITSSFGVASLSENLAEAEQLVAAADAALYASKQHGRNRVTQHGLPNTSAAMSAKRPV
jgi:diguanylate cyclase (GGDEF)-like protein